MEDYGDKVGDVLLQDSSFEDCKSYALLAYRYQGAPPLHIRESPTSASHIPHLARGFTGALGVERSTFKRGGRYAIFVDGSADFRVADSAFQANKGAFACRKHAEEGAPERARPTLSHNTLEGNEVDTESDDWSQGNLIYLHGVAV